MSRAHRSNNQMREITQECVDTILDTCVDLSSSLTAHTYTLGHRIFTGLRTMPSLCGAETSPHLIDYRVSAVAMRS